VLRRVAIVAAVAACVLAPPALANGDPASDFLPVTNVFLSLKKPSAYASGRDLLALTADAKKKKLPVKVAVIATPADLGLIQSVWKQPQPYADFLAKELVAYARYHGTLLIVMPNGYGLHGPGATPAGKKALAALPAPNTQDVDKLGKSAATAVRKIGAANGQTLVGAPGGGSGTPAWLIVVAVIGGALLITGAVFFALRGWLLKP
jgi:hypothetical protein